VGFATPSYKNSQFIGNVNSEDIITIEPEIFTPDEDGDKDVATINFTLDKPGYMLGIRIYDANGRLVRTLINNELVADKGRYTWDGINDNKEKARVGIYVIYTDVFDASGKTKHYKNKVVLGTRF
jgi:flagellar hook assembly protein FlgD